MEKKQTYEFDDEEIHILSEALMMYASYTQHMVLPNLVGDESDADKLTAQSAHAKSMAVRFFNEDNEFNWQEEKIVFSETHDRPMDVSDVSQFDFCAFAQGESGDDSN